MTHVFPLIFAHDIFVKTISIESVSRCCHIDFAIQKIIINKLVLLE